MVVACTQARVSYNCQAESSILALVVACTQARVSYNRRFFACLRCRVVACTQARVSYNSLKSSTACVRLWLAHRHGSVTMTGCLYSYGGGLWLAHRHGSVTIWFRRLHRNQCCGLHTGTGQLQSACPCESQRFRCGLHTGTGQLQSIGSSFRRRYVLWLAHRHGSVTIINSQQGGKSSCGLHTGTGQLQLQ